MLSAAGAAGGSTAWILQLEQSGTSFEMRQTKLRADSSSNFSVTMTASGTPYVVIIGQDGSVNTAFKFSFPSGNINSYSSVLDSSGNVYVGGSDFNTPNPWIAKFNSSGTNQWSYSYSGPNSYCRATNLMIADVSGSEKLFALFGEYQNWQPTSLNLDGSVNWGQKYYNTQSSPFSYGMIENNAGEIATFGLLGYNFGSGFVEFNGVNAVTKAGTSSWMSGFWMGSYPSYTQFVNPMDMAQDSNGKYYLAAARNEYNNYTRICVLDATRSYSAGKEIYGGSTGVGLGGVVVNAADEAVIVTGAGTNGFDVVAFDDTLATQWYYRITYSGGSVLNIDSTALGIDTADNHLLIQAVYSDGSAAVFRIPADAALTNGTYGDFTVSTPTLYIQSVSGGNNENTRLLTNSPSPTSVSETTTAQSLTTTVTNL
jgi:hypothetical protein